MGVERGEERQPASATRSASARGRIACRIIALLLCAVFLRAVAKFYHPGFGFTALIGFPDGHEYEPPAMQAVPHVSYPAAASYDGQFYAQRALDPLARDPAVDRAMDLAPFRARRILFSWTAYIAGAGRPAWIIDVYALQNVVCWLLLAWVLTLWLDIGRPRTLLLWTACLFSHGLLWSVRFALLDGPSLLLIALAIAAAERQWTLASAAISGVATLGRETNVIAALALPIPRTRRDWATSLAAVPVLILPIAIWMDYLWSIYRSTLLKDTDQLAFPGSAYAFIAARGWKASVASGWLSFAGVEFALIAALGAQAIYIVVRLAWRQPWWRVAAGYVVLALVLDRVLWDPLTGAVTRVLLPMTVGFNVLLRDESRATRFWAWFVVGNLHLLATPSVMPLFR